MVYVIHPCTIKLPLELAFKLTSLGDPARKPQLQHVSTWHLSVLKLHILRRVGTSQPLEPFIRKFAWLVQTYRCSGASQP